MWLRALDRAGSCPPSTASGASALPCCSPIVGTGPGQPHAPVTQCLHVIASCPAVGHGGLIWAQGCSIDPPAQGGCVAAAPGLSLLLVLLGCARTLALQRWQRAPFQSSLSPQGLWPRLSLGCMGLWVLSPEAGQCLWSVKNCSSFTTKINPSLRLSLGLVLHLGKVLGL